jgi:uncharacterized caspase-like protein
MSRDALVVGINSYSCDRLSNLKAPAEDAEKIAQLLHEYGDFQVTRLPSIKDKQNNKPVVGKTTKVTLTQLKEAIVQLFKPEGKSIPDTALLFFSGHGLQENLGVSQGFLATSDVDPESGKWGLSLDWLRKVLQSSPVRQQIVILDCCYSGELLNFGAWFYTALMELRGQRTVSIQGTQKAMVRELLNLLHTTSHFILLAEFARQFINTPFINVRQISSNGLYRISNVLIWKDKMVC